MPVCNLIDRLPLFEMQHPTGGAIEAVHEILAHDWRHWHDGCASLPAGTALVRPAAIIAGGLCRSAAGMGAVAKWVFMPSLGLTLISGLLAIAISQPFHNAGWPG